MNLVLQYTAAIRVLIYPFLPFTSDKITAILQLPPLKQNGDLVKMMNALSEGKPVIKAGTS